MKPIPESLGTVRQRLEKGGGRGSWDGSADVRGRRAAVVRRKTARGSCRAGLRAQRGADIPSWGRERAVLMNGN